MISFLFSHVTCLSFFLGFSVKFCLVAVSAYLRFCGVKKETLVLNSFRVCRWQDELWIFIKWLLYTGDQKWGTRNGPCCANGQSRKYNTSWILWLLSSTCIFIFHNVLDRTDSWSMFFVPDAPCIVQPGWYYKVILSTKYILVYLLCQTMMQPLPLAGNNDPYNSTCPIKPNLLYSFFPLIIDISNSFQHE